MQYNYMLTVGDKEFENRTINLRTRDNVVHGELELKDFISTIEKESADKISNYHIMQNEEESQCIKLQ